MFKLREESKQPVGAREFWICVGLVTLLLGGLGIVEVQTGKVPALSAPAVEVIIIGAWVVALFSMARYRRFLPWPQVASLVGMTFVLAGTAWPHSFLSVSWLPTVGALIAIGAALPQIYELRRRPISAPNGTSV